MFEEEGENFSQICIYQLKMMTINMLSNFCEVAQYLCYFLLESIVRNLLLELIVHYSRDYGLLDGEFRFEIIVFLALHLWILEVHI